MHSVLLRAGLHAHRPRWRLRVSVASFVLRRAEGATL